MDINLKYTQDNAFVSTKTNEWVGTGTTQNVYTPKIRFVLAMDSARITNIEPQPDINLSISLGGVGVTKIVPQPVLSIGNVLRPEQSDTDTFDTKYAITRYFLTLTGSPDIILPMSSFQARRRSGKQTYLSVIVPTVDFADEIAERSGGSIQIHCGYEYNGVVRQLELIVDADLDNVNLDDGASNKSTTLIGYKTETYTEKEVILSGTTYRSTRSGKNIYRLAAPYLFLNPGDTVTFSDGVTFEIDTISYSVGHSSATIEVQSI